jgi:hypothetical protein
VLTPPRTRQESLIIEVESDRRLGVRADDRDAGAARRVGTRIHEVTVAGILEWHGSPPYADVDRVTRLDAWRDEIRSEEGNGDGGKRPSEALSHGIASVRASIRAIRFTLPDGGVRSERHAIKSPL